MSKNDVKHEERQVSYLKVRHNHQLEQERPNTTRIGIIETSDVEEVLEEQGERA